MRPLVRRRSRDRVPAVDPGVHAARVALLAGTAMHLGFQSAITTLVYPTVYSGSAREIPAEQQQHIRTITPLALAVYVSLLGGAGWAALSSLRTPRSTGRTATIVSVVAATIGPVVTASASVPLHIAVSEKATVPRINALLSADRVRTCAAAVAAVAAVRAALDPAVNVDPSIKD